MFATIADVVAIVTTPEPPAVTHAYGLIRILTSRRLPAVLSLIVNRAADQAEANRVYARVAAASHKFLNFPLEDGGYVLQDSHVELAVRGRQPFVVSFPRCPSSLCVASLAMRWARIPIRRDAGSWTARFGALFA